MGKHNEPEWAKWESDFAEMVDAQKVRLSGRLSLFKGDVKDDFILADCKYTSGEFYRLTEDTWEKLADWARNESRFPVLAVKTMDAQLVVVPQDFYYELVRNPPTPRLKTEIAYKTRNLGFMQSLREPVLFVVGKYKLAAYSCECFVNDLISYEERMTV